jgi:hypothetical protein
VHFYIALAFKFACYIQPKQLIRSFTKRPELISVNLAEKLEIILRMVLITKHGGLLRMIFEQIGDKREILNSIRPHMKESEMAVDSFENWMYLYNHDFFGLLRG